MDFGLILRLDFFFFEELMISILIDHWQAHSCPKTTLISLFTLYCLTSQLLFSCFQILRVRAHSTLYSLTSQLYPLLLPSQQSHF